MKTLTLLGIAFVAISLGLPVNATPMCPELLQTDNLENKYRRLAPIHTDIENGWIFTSDQLSESYTLKSEAVHLMSGIAEEFESRGIKLAIMIAPPRPLVAGDGVVKSTLDSNSVFDTVAASDSFNQMIEQLRQTGAIVPNLLPVAQEMNQFRQYYFRRDTHWTPAGAAASALELAAEFGFSDAAFSVSDVVSSDIYEEGGSLSNIVNAICGLENDVEQVAKMNYSRIMASQGLGLFGSASEDKIALVGTSFSDRYKRDQYQVADALAAASGADVSNYSISGGGMIGPMEAFILSGDVDDYSNVIWEFPYTQSPNSTSHLRQLLGALRFESSNLSPPQSLELSSSNEAAITFLDRPLKANLIQFETETANLLRVDVVISFESGKTRTIKLRRKDRVPLDRRTTNWFADLSGWDNDSIIEIIAKFDQGVALQQVSFSYQSSVDDS